MNKKVRNILSLLLAMCLIFMSITVAFAAGEYDGKIIILHTNDVHGAIGNYAYVAGLKKDFESKGAEVILADAGDYLQGSNYVSIGKGANAVTLMNLAGYDVVTVGNHEFDYGYANLVQQFDNAEFSVTCSNIFIGDNLLFDKNYTYTASNGTKIGFFGLDAPETKTKTNPAMVKELTFSSGEALYEIAKQQVKALSQADVVICLSHLGVDNSSSPNRSTDVYRNVSGIDFMIDGHSHTVMTKGVGGEKIQSAGLGLKNVGVIVIDKNKKTIENNYIIPVDEKCPCDSNVKTVSDGYIEAVQKEYGQVFAKSEVELNGEKAPGNRTMETNLGDLITDSMRNAVIKQDDSLKVPESNVVAVTNGGGIRDYIHKGDITKNDVNTVLPFGNTICVVYITGAELLEALEASTFDTPNAVGGFPQVSGMSYTINTNKKYDPAKESYPDSTYYGPETIQRVSIDEIGGKKFDENATYAVVTNNFCAAGGDTYYAFAKATSKYDTGLAMDEVLMNYISDELGGTIGEQYAKPQGRITIKIGIKAIFDKLINWLKTFYNDYILTFISKIFDFFN
ncbi:MAG: bifunctional metallophosphatase/5'-nucleotidase, partial [Ruminococcus sp.]|nr:bifunctional metallophosphatase/5'-nucleotidase [Candidatus Copronaster equi]